MVDTQDATMAGWGTTLRLLLVLWGLITLPALNCAPPDTSWRKSMTGNQWGTPTEGLAISLSVPEPVYRLGEPVVIDITLKNVATTPVPVVIRSVWYDYSLSVRDEDRAELAPTPYATQRIEAAAEGRRATRDLGPGDMLADDCELSKAFDMTRPGSYTIVATRETYKLGTLDQYATVTSNELTVTVGEE